MVFKRLALIGLVLGVGIGTAGCTDGYGYSGVGVGYGAPVYGDPYGYGGGGFAGGYGVSSY